MGRGWGWAVVGVGGGLAVRVVGCVPSPSSLKAEEDNVGEITAHILVVLCVIFLLAPIPL